MMQKASRLSRKNMTDLIEKPAVAPGLRVFILTGRISLGLRFYRSHGSCRFARSVALIFLLFGPVDP